MHKIDGFYINLASSVGRREQIEKTFHASNLDENWTLTRFEALTPADEMVQHMEGHATDKLKGNYLSHLECIKLSRGSENHALIAEDDTIFGARTEYWVNRVIDVMPPESWDVIFTDIYVAAATAMPKLARLRHNCMAEDRVVMFGAHVWDNPWAGAGSYVVNQRSKDKLLAALTMEAINTPFDMVLREAVRTRALNGIIIFPFITSVSDEADKSLVRASDDMIETILLHYFRKLMWVGADNSPENLAKMRDEILALEIDKTSGECELLGTLLGRLLPLQYHWED
jgi:GR25 family glycosyltransferase involved in LPS biosynthesis